MKILQKTVYGLYSLTGISILLFSFCNCEREVEYRLDVKFVFVNETDRWLSFEVFDDGVRTAAELLPGGTYSVINNASGGFENPDPATCCQGILNGVLAGADNGSIFVRFNEVGCSLQSVAEIKNHKAMVVGYRSFQYTFSFTDSVLNSVTGCRALK